jgi:hypothetical protein
MDEISIPPKTAAILVIGATVIIGLVVWGVASDDSRPAAGSERAEPSAAAAPKPRAPADFHGHIKATYLDACSFNVTSASENRVTTAASIVANKQRGHDFNLWNLGLTFRREGAAWTCQGMDDENTGACGLALIHCER